MDYTYGLGKIYTEEEIEKAKISPSFEREYNLQYLGGIGNVFHTKDIDAAIEKGKLYDPTTSNAHSQKCMGIDPAYGSSSFGIVVVQFVDGQLQILHAEEYKRPDFNGNARFQILISCFIVITLISVPLITTITSDNSGLSFDNGFTIRSVSASSEEGSGGDGGSNQVEGGDQTEGEEQTGDQEQDEEEQAGSEPEETTSPETDDKTEAYETDDAQQIPTPETSPLSPLAIAPTLTPTPGASPTLALSPPKRFSIMYKSKRAREEILMFGRFRYYSVLEGLSL